ncbi:hypothetical protein WN944_006610 [Citrus x changshan-huyou]|uniref:Uncharacterized protein n=1 Tax=Citrus x changshan-huyou TaxID=2935761 RepID=A0AAP0MLD7_9ROSI
MVKLVFLAWNLKKWLQERSWEMIITTKVVREISVIFHECISRPWITFSEYPQEAFDRLFGNFKNVGFAYTSTEEELKEAVRKCVKSRYPDWMLE